MIIKKLAQKMTGKLAVMTAAVMMTITISGAFTGIAQADTTAQSVEDVNGATEEVLEPEIFVTGSIKSCEIMEDKANICLSFTSSGETTNTDGKLYLFELQPYEDNIGERTDAIGTFSIGADQTTQFALNQGTAADRLYSSFILAVYNGTRYVEVSKAHYITNPEAVASRTFPYYTPLSKKGLSIELDMFADAYELGVRHAGMNIAFQQILGEGIDYEYDGKVYHFNKAVVEDYDKIVTSFNEHLITVTAVILNGWNEAQPNLFRPGVEPVKQPLPSLYYMFNVATKEGFEQTRAIAAFLAERYSGADPKHGKIANWVIGNEINNQQWNYGGLMSLDDYVEAYEKAFRVFYTAIKTSSANDRIFFSLDYYWNNPAEKVEQYRYTGKEIIDTFNTAVRDKGQMDWGLSYHAYPYPMIEPEFWDDGQTGLFTNDFNSPVINFNNINLLTDYFKQDGMRNADGEVRHIILTEQGFTAVSLTRGDVEQIQAAAFAYSYYLVDSNPYIDAYILGRQVDAPAEVKTGVSMGLWSCDMNQPNRIVANKRRKIWAVFKNIDKKSATLENTEFAKSIIGIHKWSDVIPDFKWKSIEN